VVFIKYNSVSVLLYSSILICNKLRFNSILTSSPIILLNLSNDDCKQQLVNNFFNKGLTSLSIIFGISNLSISLEYWSGFLRR
jgi:hypothetical protein